MAFSRSIKLLHLVPILRKYSAFLQPVCVHTISLSHCSNFTCTFVQEWKCPAVIPSVQSPMCAVVMAAWTRDIQIKLHFYICRDLYPVCRRNIGWYKAERKGFSNSGFHRNIHEVGCNDSRVRTGVVFFKHMCEKFFIGLATRIWSSL
jgi:hypothetical protein